MRRSCPFDDACEDPTQGAFMKIPNIAKLTRAVLLAAAPGSWAASNAGAPRLSLEAGAAFPTGVNNFSDSAKTGLVGGAQYLFRGESNFRLGIQGDYYHFPARDHLVTSP